MTWIQKADKWWIGLLAGLLFPAIMFFFYWLFFHHNITFPHRFIRYLKNGYLLSNVIKICGLGNLLIFYLGLNAKIDRFNRGIIISVIAYVLLIAYVTYYLEPEYI
ncbi:hypothetical protein CNR22_00950 [Sphingobacteriaceae bacterium]|nr:hypothetical protein CNR22_00950 [Sphingobacteriaceae bacterium]